MTEPERAKQLAPVEANEAEQDSIEDEEFETPTLAVWLSLGAIIVAGLYGLYLGTSAKAKPQSDAKATSSYVMTAGARMAQIATSSFGERLT